MSALSKIYSDATGKTERALKRAEALSPFGAPSNVSPAEDAARKQLKLSWLQSSVTEEMFKSLATEFEQIVNQAIELACTYPTNQNHQQIIQLLVRAEELRKINRTYGRN